MSSVILAVKKVFVFWGHFTKACSAKSPPFTVKAFQKTACHKIQWLQFVTRNIAGPQPWYSRKHFRIPVTLQFGHCNFDLALTATSAWQAQLYVNVDFPNIIGWRVIVIVDWNLKNGMHWCECHCAAFWWEIWIGFDTWKSTKNRRALPLDDNYVHYVGNLNNMSASFYCMYFFNIVRHHIIFIFNTFFIFKNGQYQVFFNTFFGVCVKCCKKVGNFEWSAIILEPFTSKCMCTLQAWTLAAIIQQGTNVWVGLPSPYKDKSNEI